MDATFIIVDQPAAYGTRFRYVSEGTCHGPILGQSTTPGNRTHPTIRCNGNFTDGQDAILLVSIISDDPRDPLSYGMHGHTFFGRNVYNGQYIAEIQANSGIFSHQLQGVTIIHTKGADKNDVLSGKYIQDILLQKEGIQNYKTLMDRNNGTTTTDQLNLNWFYQQFPNFVSESKYEAAHVQYLANQVRLKFDIFIKNPYTQSFSNPPLTVLSQIVHNTRDREHKPLHIQRCSRTSGSPNGNEEVFLFCDEFISKDLEVCFYHGQFPGEYIGKGSFSPTDIHNKSGLVFKTPSLKRSINVPLLTHFCLKRSDMSSNSFDFTYYPLPPERYRQFPESSEIYTLQNSPQLKSFDMRPEMSLEGILPNSLYPLSDFGELGDQHYLNNASTQDDVPMKDFPGGNAERAHNFSHNTEFNPDVIYHNPPQTQFNIPYSNSQSLYSHNSTTHTFSPIDNKASNQHISQPPFAHNIPPFIQPGFSDFYPQSDHNMHPSRAGIPNCDSNIPQQYVNTYSNDKNLQ